MKCKSQLLGLMSEFFFLGLVPYLGQSLSLRQIPLSLSLSHTHIWQSFSLSSGNPSLSSGNQRKFKSQVLGLVSKKTNVLGLVVVTYIGQEFHTT